MLSAVHRWLNSVPTRLRWILLVIYCVVVAGLMLAPPPPVLTALTLFKHEDKLIHFVVYGFLVWIFRWALAAGQGSEVGAQRSEVRSQRSGDKSEVSTDSPSSDSPSSVASAKEEPSSASPPSYQLSTINHQLTVTAGAIAYGALMEGLQLLLANYNRSFEWMDIAANTAGALTFWLLSSWIGGGQTVSR